jgi:hypothetical protein
MQKEISQYLDWLKDKVEHKISSLLRDEDVTEISRRAIQDYFGSTKSSPFHIYYFETISNKEMFLSDPDFFGKFKQQYSLQGVDRGYLTFLEDNKAEILRLIENEDVSTLYFEFFAEAPIKHGEEKKRKSLGSFFAKLVHTFAPDKYCALDNPIKQRLGLEKESFFISFIVISEACKEWSVENPAIMDKIKLELAAYAKENPLYLKMTDLKILDLILWYWANRELKS